MNSQVGQKSLTYACFYAIVETEFQESVHSQTEFGNEMDLVYYLSPSTSPYRTAIYLAKYINGVSINATTHLIT